MKLAAACRTLALLAGLSGLAIAQAATPVLVGMTLPLTGPQAVFGTALRDGALLAVARANAAGGVGGRPIELAVRDDGGDPRRAAANASLLLEAGVVAISGVLGDAATAAVAETLAPPGGGPALAALVAPVSSADRLRDPAHRGVFHLRAGMAEQASAALLHLDTLGIERYALLVQDDLLGNAAFERLQFELTRIALRPVAVVHVAADGPALAVQQAMATVCAAQPQALIVALDAERAAEALRLSQSRKCASQHLVFSDTGAVLAASGPAGAAPHPLAGLLVTQVVPHPQQRLHPLVDEFQRERSARGASATSHAALEGYLALRVVVEALGACQREPDRKCVLQALASRSFDLPGLRVAFGRAQRQLRPFVEITMLDAQGRLRH